MVCCDLDACIHDNFTHNTKVFFPIVSNNLNVFIKINCIYYSSGFYSTMLVTYRLSVLPIGVFLSNLFLKVD